MTLQVLFLDTGPIKNFYCFLQIPSPPNNCCMSGCANCVWIQYADELHEKLQHGTKFAREVISREVEDVNMRAYLDMELRVLEDSKKKDDDDTKK